MMLAVLLLGISLLPQDENGRGPGNPPVILALRAGGAVPVPAVDGRLDDPAWAAADVATNFVQFTPRPGSPSVQRTEARVVYTEDALYVGMWMYDTAPDSIQAPLARRDASGVHSDFAHVIIDSYHDRRTAFRFSVNPKGVQRDIFHYGDVREDLSWNAVWEVATRVDSLGWTAEFRIPLSQLRFNTHAGGELTWGINFGRDIARHDERSVWAPVEPNSGRFVSFSGELRGLAGLRPPRQLELQPYASTRYRRAPGDPTNPFHSRHHLDGSAGLDLKYGLTSDLTLTASFNPDFGQVEADPSEVNLTAFETFLMERRPFFQEGTDIFNSVQLGQVDVMGGERVFYSRRIGRAPQRRISGAGFVDAPEGTTILSAAKLSGKTRGGWSVGVLSALTAPERARVFTDGVTVLEAVEPMTNYAMARVARDFRLGESALGGVFTATNRFLDEDGPVAFLRSAAYVGGVDGRHRFGGNYQLSGTLLGSRLEGSPRAIEAAQRSSARYFQRPDARHVDLDPTRTSLQGLAATLDLEKFGGGSWRWGLRNSLRTPGFEVNDLGFMRTADVATAIAGIEHVRSRSGRVFRNYRAELGGGSSWTMGGERTLTAVVLQGNGQLVNLWGGGGALIRFLPAYSPVLLRGGPALYTAGGTQVVFGLGGDPRRPVRLGAEGRLEVEDGTGGHSWTVGPSISFRSSTRTSASIAPTLARNAPAWQFVTRQSVDGEPRYVGARLSQTTAAITARVNHAFTPTLSLQFYAQPFVSGGRYHEFREVADSKASAFDARYRPIPASRRGSNPDFNVKQLRSNAVLRWEYGPGSTFFLVWSQGRQDSVEDGSFALRRDFGRLLGFDRELAAPATNVLLLKVSYWLDR
jgi:hypothetical protein